MAEQRDPSFLKTPPKPPPGPDPYRTPEKPRRVSSPEPEPEQIPAVLTEAPRRAPTAPRPELDPKEAVFRAKLAAAHAADRREANSIALAALGLVVFGTAFIVWEFLTPGTMVMVRRRIPAVAIVIPAVVVAFGYLVHHILRRMQGRSP